MPAASHTAASLPEDYSSTSPRRDSERAKRARGRGTHRYAFEQPLASHASELEQPCRRSLSDLLGPAYARRMRHMFLALLFLLAAAPANAMAAGWSDPAVVGGRTSSAVSVGVGDDGSAVALWQSKSDLFAAVRGAGA